MDSCLFCRIVNGETTARIVYEDDRAVAFWDITPQAPVHLLIVPRQHISSLAEAGSADEGILGHLLVVSRHLAEKEGILQQGYRTVINTNQDAGQTVYHLHVHVLGGRAMQWPPG